MPERLNKKTCQELSGDLWNETIFDELAEATPDGGEIVRDKFLAYVESANLVAAVGHLPIAGDAATAADVPADALIEGLHVDDKRRRMSKVRIRHGRR